MRYILFNRTPDTASWWGEDCLKSKLAIQGIQGMTGDSTPPILDHALNQPSAFTPKTLIDDVRRKRHIPAGIVPPVCILEFDGDITDGLVRDGLAKPFKPWACFHTSMFTMDLEGVTCGIIARTIGGPFAVLIAEQLQTAGAKLIIGLTSAGRVSPDLPLPCLVVVASAIRDEGTSYHYVAPGNEVACKSPVLPLLERELIATGWAVRSGKVWTTDAPYRETKAQLNKWAREGVLAVEMQAASLFAFGIARQASVASVAMVSNAVDHAGAQFDTGSQDDGLRVLKGIARAARSLFATA
jgi:uridine phosphorylase